MIIATSTIPSEPYGKLSYTPDTTTEAPSVLSNDAPNGGAVTSATLSGYRGLSSMCATRTPQNLARYLLNYPGASRYGALPVLKTTTQKTQARLRSSWASTFYSPRGARAPSSSEGSVSSREPAIVHSRASGATSVTSICTVAPPTSSIIAIAAEHRKAAEHRRQNGTPSNPSSRSNSQAPASVQAPVSAAAASPPGSAASTNYYMATSQPPSVSVTDVGPSSPPSDPQSMAEPYVAAIADDPSQEPPSAQEAPFNTFPSEIQPAQQPDPPSPHKQNLPEVSKSHPVTSTSDSLQNPPTLRKPNYLSSAHDAQTTDSSIHSHSETANVYKPRIFSTSELSKNQLGSSSTLPPPCGESALRGSWPQPPKSGGSTALPPRAPCSHIATDSLGHRKERYA